MNYRSQCNLWLLQCWPKSAQQAWAWDIASNLVEKSRHLLWNQALRQNYNGVGRSKVLSDHHHWRVSGTTKPYERGGDNFERTLHWIV